MLRGVSSLESHARAYMALAYGDGLVPGWSKLESKGAKSRNPRLRVQRKKKIKRARLESRKLARPRWGFSALIKDLGRY